MVADENSSVPNYFTISLQQARRLCLRKQLLFDTRLPKGKAGALAAIEALGYVQIDSINVVERAHHLTLRSRCPDYQPRFLHDLQAKDRRVFEYWGHAMCFLPMSDYRFYRRHMESFPSSSAWYRLLAKRQRGLTEDVLRRVRDEGPLAAADFEDTRNRKRGTWWDWKPAKAALEMLFYRGDLMIRERRGFERVYDLTERVLPSWADTRLPAPDEAQEFFARRALGSLGPATIRDINRHITIGGKLQGAVDQLVTSGEVSAVRVEGSDTVHYILALDLDRIDADDTGAGRVILLSPFDNAIILRDRVRALFGFDYALECYLPAAKRKHGYFCLPILWGERLVGRIDPKADRRNGALVVNNLHLEKPKELKPEFYPALATTVREFADFHACTRVEFSRNVPTFVKAKLSREIKRTRGRPTESSRKEP